jgi:hypothetical protein
MAPPKALLLAVPLGANQERRSPSSGSCAYMVKLDPINIKKNNFFIIDTLILKNLPLQLTLKKY